MLYAANNWNFYFKCVGMFYCSFIRNNIMNLILVSSIFIVIVIA